MKASTVALMGAGGLFLWSGFHGASVLGSLRDLVSGHQPSGTPAYSLTSSSSSTATTGTLRTGYGGQGGGLSNGQLQQLWVQAGGNPARAGVAACIAQAESSGQAGVTSPNPDGGTNVGLWQLDTKGKGAGYSVAQLQNPQINAMVAVKGSSNGTDWSAWSTASGCGA